MRRKELAIRFPRSCSDINCGANYPAEWDQPVLKALEAIEALDSKVQVVQIKSKFGGLRLYCHAPGPAPGLSEIVLQAEAEVRALEKART